MDATLDVQLADAVIIANDRTVALIELLGLYGDEMTPISHKLPKILECFRKATTSGVVCLDYTMPDGEMLYLTMDGDSSKRGSYFDTVGVDPNSYHREMLDRGYYEHELEDGRYLLITPVGGMCNLRGYLGAQRDREFEQIDIAVAGVFADSIPRIEEFSYKVPY